MSEVEEPGFIPLLRTRSALDLSPNRHERGKKLDENSHRSISVMTNMNLVQIKPPLIEKPPNAAEVCEGVTVSTNNEKVSTKDFSSDCESQISIASCTSTRNKNSVQSKIPIAIKSSATSPALNSQISNKNSLSKSPLRLRRGTVKDIESQYSAKVKRLSVVKRNLEDKQNRALELYNSIKSMRAEILAATNKELPIEEVEFKVCTSERDLTSCNNPNLTDEETKKNLNLQLQELASSLLDTSYQLINESCDVFNDFLEEPDEMKPADIMTKIEKRKEELRHLENRVISDLNSSEAIIDNILEKINWVTSREDHSERASALQLLKSNLVDAEEKLKQAEVELEIEVQNTLVENEKFQKSDARVAEIMLRLENLANDLAMEKSNMNAYKTLETQSQNNLNIYFIELEGLNKQKKTYESKIEELSSHINVLENQWGKKLQFLMKQNQKLEEGLKAKKEHLNKMKRSRKKFNLGFLFNVALYFIYDIINADIYF